MELRHILRIAKWEVTKNAGGLDRRTIVIMGLAVVAMGLVAGLAIGGGSPGLDSGIYRVGVDDTSPYAEPVAADPTFLTRQPSREGVATGSQELLIRDTVVGARAPTPKGRAAQTELRNSIDRYNENTMQAATNQTAAFPVAVTLQYKEQTGVQERFTAPEPAETDSGRDDSEGEITPGSNTEGEESTPAPGTESTSSGTTPPASSETEPERNGEETASPDTPTTPQGPQPQGGDSDSAGLSALGGGLTGNGVSGSPADIQPPFPFDSLVLAFLFVVPLNFVIQAYGSTMLSERLKRRGELLLVSPVTRYDIIAGKTLPYLLGAITVISLITAGLKYSGIAPAGSPIAVLAVLPLALLFLAATFCGAMFARSFKELTFVTVTVTVSLTSYAFVPAIFTEVTPIALISPLTIVVRDIQGQAITLGEFAFSTLPPTLTAVILFGLGAGLYREEDMFTQRSIPLKVLDSLSGQIASRRSAAKISMLLLPFVFVAELAAVAMLFALQELSIPLILVTVVVIEELAKSLHIFAGYSAAKYDRSLRTAVILGGFSGLGFFVAEKFVLIARIADLQTIDTGRAALVTGLAPDGVPVIVVALLFLLAPLLLHVITATVSTLGARRGKRPYAVGLAIAMGVHFCYNYAVVVLIG
jgi:ABC-type Na+ efflux pump permease subunit